MSGSWAARSRTQGAVSRMHLVSTLSRDPSSALGMWVCGQCEWFGDSWSGRMAEAWHYSAGRQAGRQLGQPPFRGVSKPPSDPPACTPGAPATEGWMHRFLRLDSPRARILGAPPAASWK